MEELIRQGAILSRRGFRFVEDLELGLTRRILNNRESALARICRARRDRAARRELAQDILSGLAKMFGAGDGDH